MENINLQPETKEDEREISKGNQSNLVSEDKTFDFWVICETEDQLRDVLNNKPKEIFTDLDNFEVFYNTLSYRLNDIEEDDPDFVFKSHYSYEQDNIDGYFNSHFKFGNAACVEWTVKNGLGTCWGVDKILKHDFDVNQTLVLDYVSYIKLCTEISDKAITRLTKELVEKFKLNENYPDPITFIDEKDNEGGGGNAILKDLGAFIKLDNLIIRKDQISSLVLNRLNIELSLINKEPFCIFSGTNDQCREVYDKITSFLN